MRQSTERSTKSPERKVSLLDALKKRLPNVENVDYAQLRIKHESKADADFVLKQVEDRRPDILLCEWSGLSEQDIKDLSAFVWDEGPDPFEVASPESFEKTLFVGLREMRKKHGYAPRLVFPDLRDNKITEQRAEVGLRTGMLADLLRLRKFRYKQALQFVEKTYTKFVFQNITQRETTILKTLGTNFLAMEHGQYLEAKKSITVLGMFGSLHRGIFNALDVGEGKKEIIPQTRPRVREFSEEFALRLMHGEHMPDDLVANMLVDISLRNYPFHLPPDVQRSPNAKRALIRRIARLCTKKDKEALYDAFLLNDNSAIMRILKTKEIFLPDIQG